MSGAHQRYGKNYELDQLELATADEVGFLIGISRLGVGRLTSTAGDWVSILDQFVSISCSAGMRVVDGAWLEPDLSGLTLVTRDQSALGTYDGSEIRLRYLDAPGGDGPTIFDGIVLSSELLSELDENNLEVFTVTLLARGFEAIRNGLTATGTATTIYFAGGGGTPVVQWDAGRIRTRAADITDGTVSAEDDRADVYLDGLLDDEPDVSGTQGELLADLAIRAGLLVDVSSGAGVAFRAYQGAPLWQLEDEHLVSGYGLAYDRDSASALAVSRHENTDYVLAFRAGDGRRLAQREISMGFDDAWAAATFAGTVALQGQARQYLTGAVIPRHDDLVLPERLPIEARFRHDGVTHRGAVIGLQHTISKARWMMTADCAPVHFITRVGDGAPAAPRHVAGAIGGTTATLTWSLEAAGTVQTGSTSGAFSLLTADADVVDVGDDLRLHTSGGTLKEDTIFRVTAKAAPSGGKVLVSVSPAPAATASAGDLLRYSDFGLYPLGGWTIWYQEVLPGPTFDYRQITPSTPGSVPVSKTVFTNSATITGLTSGESYRFSVYALSDIAGVHSAPSDLIELAVP